MSDSPEAPKCRKCGKRATQRDIDGDWWPPCRCGIQHLKYDDEILDAQPEPGLVPYSSEEVREIRRNRMIGPTYHFFKAHDDDV